MSQHLIKEFIRSHLSTDLYSVGYKGPVVEVFLSSQDQQVLFGQQQHLVILYTHSNNQYVSNVKQYHKPLVQLWEFWICEAKFSVSPQP